MPPKKKKSSAKSAPSPKKAAKAAPSPKASKSAKSSARAAPAAVPAPAPKASALKKEKKEKRTEKKEEKRDVDTLADELMVPTNAMAAQIQAAFEKVHQSSATHQEQKAVLLALAANDASATVDAICDVVVTFLPNAGNTDVCKRHTAFLGELSKEFRRRFGGDELACRCVRTVMKYHNATDKSIRYAVCSFLHVLLKAFDVSIASQERAQLYDAVVAALKYRVHDKFAPVREKAIAAIAMFQTGSVDDDVTQLLLCAMCQDTSSNVRRQAIESAGIVAAAYNPELLLPHYVRLTTDVVALVRRAAWDKLGKLNFPTFVSQCKCRRLDALSIIAHGLSDNMTVSRISAENTVFHIWLEQDPVNWDPIEFLHRLDLSSSDASASLLAEKLYDVVRKRHRLLTKRAVQAAARQRDGVKQETDGDAAAAAAVPVAGLDDEFEASNLVFPLQLKGLTPANVLLWRACAQALVRDGAREETEVLPPIREYGDVLHDLYVAFVCGNDAPAPPKLAHLINVDHVDQILDVILGAFSIYSEGGYLTHTDDGVRQFLSQRIGILLTATPESNPSLYVGSLVHAAKMVTNRDPHRRTKLIHDAIQQIFAALVLPRSSGLGYDDVEAFKRADAMCRHRLQQYREARPQTAEPSDDEESLATQINNDTNLLMRMVRIVHCYLGECQRGEHLPAYCSHIINLGRNQGDAQVRALATYALSLQCLMSSQTVHTFLPLLLKDIEEAKEGKIAAVVGDAALGGVIDLVAEYGFKFFASGRPEDNYAATAGGAAEAAGVRTNVPGATPSQQNRQGFLQEDSYLLEHGTQHWLQQQQQKTGAAIFETPSQLVAGVKDVKHEGDGEGGAAHRLDDCAKVGSSILFETLLSTFLKCAHPAMVHTTAEGFCKLLACNRVPAEEIPTVVAHLLLYLTKLEQRRDRTVNTLLQAQIKQLDYFLTSFSYGHHKRQAAVYEGGLLALRAILSKHRSLNASPQATKLLKRLVDLTDAAFLQNIRDVDPTFAIEVSRRNNEAANDNDDVVSVASATSTASARRRSSKLSALGGQRLWRELGRYSLHESLAFELLVEVVSLNCPSSQRLILDGLRSLHFYKRDILARNLLLTAVDEAKGMLSEALVTRLDEFASWLEDQIAGGGDGTTTINTTSGTNATTTAAIDGDNQTNFLSLEISLDARQQRRNENVKKFDLAIMQLLGLRPAPGGEAEATGRDSGSSLKRDRSAPESESAAGGKDEEGGDEELDAGDQHNMDSPPRRRSFVKT